MPNNDNAFKFDEDNGNSNLNIKKNGKFGEKFSHQSAKKKKPIPPARNNSDIKKKK